MKTWTLALVASVFALPALAAELPHLAIKPGEYTVSGLSSGAFFADQYHIAFSSEVRGSGLVAGGLYGCTVSAISGDEIDASIFRALDTCMADDKNDLETLPRFTNWVDQFAAKGWIDPTEGLKGDQVYLFTGRNDTTVRTETVERAAELYAHYGARTTLLTALPDGLGGARGAGHGFVTVADGIPCSDQKLPFINACGYDQAKAVLETTMGTKLNPPAASVPAGHLVPFDQTPFVSDGKSLIDAALWDEGFVYVPQTCADGAECELHVVFHGCQQSAQNLEPTETFPTLTGYNRWAETNDIVVLYPQARSLSMLDGFSPLEGNPNGCWNWWGFGNDDNFAIKTGLQMQAVKAMVDGVRGL